MMIPAQTHAKAVLPTTVAFYVAIQPHSQYIPSEFNWHKVVATGYTDDKRKQREKDVVLITLETTEVGQKFPLFAWVKKDDPDSDMVALYSINTSP